MLFFIKQHSIFVSYFYLVYGLFCFAATLMFMFYLYVDLVAFVAFVDFVAFVAFVDFALSLFIYFYL